MENVQVVARPHRVPALGSGWRHGSQGGGGPLGLWSAGIWRSGKELEEALVRVAQRIWSAARRMSPSVEQLCSGAEEALVAKYPGGEGAGGARLG
jgi:hypothetical protein